MTTHETRVQIGLDSAEERQPVEIEDESFRILIVGDFGGGARSAVVPLADRAIRIDRDGVDAAMAIVAPELRLPLDPAAGAEVIAFQCLDDLHPDRLLETVPLLARLRSLRAELMRPGAPSPTTQPDARRAEPVAGRSLLDQILDTQPNEAAIASGGGDLSDFIRRAVRPHLAPEVTEAQAGAVKQVDDALVAALRVLLHEPRFQALEAAWRGADFIVRRADGGSGGQIAIADLSESGLRGALAADATNTLSDLLLSPAGAPRWSLVLCTHAFGPDDVGLLSRLAATAAHSHTPWIVGALPALAGAATFADGADADEWDTSPPQGWDALRESPQARYLGAALPRFLLRAPYGARTDTIETMPFEEFAGGPAPHENYLWGSGALLCGLIAAEEVEHGAPRSSQGTIGGLPLHVARVDGLAVAKPCAEAYMSQRTVMHLLDRGLTPLVSLKDGDAVRIPRLQSLAAPPSALAFGAAGGR